MLDIEQELIVRRALASIVGTVASAGYVIPSARYCSGIEEYWGSRDGVAKDTRDEIEDALIDSTWIYPVGFLDDTTSGGSAHSPLIRLSYELYIFRQYGLLREDETETPDVFDKKVLVQHNEFIAGWLGIKAAFQRNAAIAALDAAVFVRRHTTPVFQAGEIVNQAICEFVPGAIGFAVRLRETVELQLREC